MTLDDLDLPTTVRADAERFAEELGMSEDILIDHVRVVYAPAEGDDHERARVGILTMIKAQAEGQDVIDPES